jgi:hypothetical protein
MAKRNSPETDPILLFWNAPDDALLPPHVIAEVRGVSTALLDRERWQGVGPPYRKVNGRILYHKGGTRVWLEAFPIRPEGARPKADTQPEAST